MSVYSGGLRLDPASCQFAIEHILAHEDTDLFPLPGEIEALALCKDQLLMELQSKDITAIELGERRVAAFPNHSGGFLRATQLDIVDTVILTALVHQVGPLLEKSRYPPNQVFSYRFAPTDNELYDPAVNFATFRQACVTERYSKHGWKHVVVAGISTFYPHICTHRLKNAMDSIAKGTDNPTERDVLLQASTIIHDHLLKTWNGGQSDGLPLGCAASHLLAEIILNDVDAYLRCSALSVSELVRGTTDHHPQALRFSDTFVIYCKTEREAIMMLQELATYLDSEHHLSLQSHRTCISTFKHYISLEEPDADGKLSRILNDASFGHQIDPAMLSRDMQSKRALRTLPALLKQQLDSPASTFDPDFIDFALRKMRDIQDWTLVPKLSEQDTLCKLYPCIRGVTAYLSGTPQSQRKDVGSAFKIYLSSRVGTLDVVCAYLISVVKDAPGEWGFDEGTLLPLCQQIHAGPLTNATALWALGNLAKNSLGAKNYLSSARFRSIQTLSPWERRAFLYALRLFDNERADATLKSCARDLDLLDKAVFQLGRK